MALTSNETSPFTTDAIQRVYIFSKLSAHTQVIYSNGINSEIEIQLYLSPVTILLFEFTPYVATRVSFVLEILQLEALKPCSIYLSCLAFFFCGNPANYQSSDYKHQTFERCL